jgi:hypothetical protein|tara:strand:- start:1662 stop:4784 length:3123 start_codon:yes stop_codon:yes gene_type:complete
MASNNYSSANVVPSADTFREWVDLTNRITYDMEKVVVTTAANTQGARTSGNASVNGHFSANTLLVETSMRGASANSTIYGTKAPSANLLITSNVVFDSGNSTVGAIIHAQSNAHFTGANVEFSSNVSINSTSTSFTSNAITNIFNTKIDANANLDIDNALTQVTSTNTVIENGQLNITSNVNFDAASFDILAGALNVTQSNSTTHAINIDPTTNTFTSNAGINVFNTTVDINNSLTTVDSTNTTIASGELNITSNVNIDSALIDINAGVFTATPSSINIDPSATTLTSNAGTNIFNTPVDINANIDVDNTLTDFTSTTFNVSGTTALVDSVTTNIHGTTLDVNSNTSIEAATLVVGANSTFNGDIDATANVQIGNANSDLFNVSSNTVLNDKLTVVKAADLKSTLNVDGATTLNGAVTLGNATGDDLTFTGYAATGITPKANGTLSIGTAALRFDANLDDVSIDDLNVIDSATVLGTGHFGNNFAVNTAFTIGFGGAASNTKTITIGAAADSNNRVIIKGLVGNSTVGVLPLANGVSLGNTTHQWDVVGRKGNFSNTVAAGNTTVTGFMKASGEVEGGSLDINGVADISGKLDLHAGANVAGAINHTSGILTVTGATALNGGLTMDTNKFTVADTSGNVGTAGTLSVAGNTTITSAQQANATVAALKVTGGILALKDIKTAANGNFGYVNITSNLDVDVNANIDGNLVVDGTTTLGDAIGDTIKLTGQVFGNSTVGIIPSANGGSIGTNTKRWKLNTTTINASGDITAGGDVDITGQANTSTLRVRTTSTLLGAVNFGNSTINANLSANSTQSLFAVDKVVVEDFTASGSVSLPSNTVLNLATANTADLSVTNSAVFSTGANTTVSFGDGNGRATITFANAVFDSTFGPANTNINDIGSAALSWRTGYFDTSLVVGNTTANTTAVLADNIYARDDLVASYSSDENLKDNIVVLDEALNRVESISGYSFDWNSKVGDYREGTPDYGVLAQEIENILPNAVTTNGRGYKTVSYNAVIPLLVEAIKELSAKVDRMQAEREGEE